jgi:hypothetical protein
MSMTLRHLLEPFYVQDHGSGCIVGNWEVSAHACSRSVPDFALISAAGASFSLTLFILPIEELITDASLMADEAVPFQRCHL